MSNNWFENIKKEFIEKAKIHGSVEYHDTELHTDGTGDIPHVLLKIRINKPAKLKENDRELID